MISEDSRDRFLSMLEKAAERTLADVGEKDLLAEFLLPMCRSLCGDHGLGDDVGLLNVPTDNTVAVTTDRVPSDLLARQLGLMSPVDFGAYLVRVNISDLAAAGADPLGMVITSAFRPQERMAYVLEVMWGAYLQSAQLGCPVIGGDTKAALEESLSATAIGAVPEGKSVGRGQVRPGMRIYLSGPVGHAGVALRWFMRKANERRGTTPEVGSLGEELREHLIRPRPRIDLAKALRESGCPCAMDITDGLGQSLSEIAVLNSVDLEVDFESLRFYPATIRAAEKLRLDMRDVLGGIGLDLELLAIGDAVARPEGFYDVGRVVAGGGEVRFSDGQKMLIRGFEHFTRSPRDFIEDGLD